MQGELTKVAQTEDCAAGVQLLVDTLKKQQVTNFAMQQEFMDSLNVSHENTNWKNKIIVSVKQARDILVSQNLTVMQEIQAVVQRQIKVEQSNNSNSGNGYSKK